MEDTVPDEENVGDTVGEAVTDTDKLMDAVSEVPYEGVALAVGVAVAVREEDNDIDGDVSADGGLTT